MNSGWRTSELGSIFEIERGGSPRPIRDYLTDKPDGINWIKIGDTQGVTKYISATAEKIRPEGAKRSRMVFEGDFILSNSMSFGRPYIMKTSGCIHDGWLVLRQRQQQVNKDYLYYVLTSDLVFQQFDRLAAGSTVRNLNIGLVRAVKIPLPPYAEQLRIAAVLDKAFAAIAAAKANAEKNLQNARDLFGASLKEAFGRRLAGWNRTPLRCVCDIKHGFAFDGVDFSDRLSPEYPTLITPGNFTEKGTLLFNEKNTKCFKGAAPAGFRFDVGDLVIVMTDLSAKMKILGKPAFVERGDVLHNQRIGRFLFKTDAVEKRLVYYFLLTEGFAAGVKASSTGTMVRHSAPSRILNALLPFPKDRSEQKALISRLDSVRSKTDLLEAVEKKKIAALDELKKSLLHEAFNGRL